MWYYRRIITMVVLLQLVMCIDIGTGSSSTSSSCSASSSKSVYNYSHNTYHHFVTKQTISYHLETNSEEKGDNGGTSEAALATRRSNARRAEATTTTTTPEKWEAIYVGCVLLAMFAMLIWDRVGADWVLVLVLTLCMASTIISVKEGLAGFASDGIWTVMVLFVVATGISNTGALDWYMCKMLGKPRDIPNAQLRVFIPLAIVSAFLNNTPIVVIMIPVLQRWSRNIGIHVGQLMLPMCYAVVLGGTCTFIGSSTNLVALGLLQQQNPEAAAKVSLFSLGIYGVPIALAGLTYMLIFSTWLLPHGGSSNMQSDDDAAGADDGQPVLLGARLTKWSSAAGRTVKRSGLRDTGGIYLVSVRRAVTGNVHRAVGQDFVLNIGDILYFAPGIVGEFPKFCDEHGLETVTAADATNSSIIHHQSAMPSSSASLTINHPIGSTKESLEMADAAIRMRIIHRMIDCIHGKLPITCPDEIDQVGLASDVDPAQILVSHDNAALDQDLVIIGVNSHDRPGLLNEISKCLTLMKLQCHRTEAAVIGLRSFSVWRCELLEHDGNDLNDIWESLKEVLSNKIGLQKGLSIVRATVTDQSRLVGATIVGSEFRATYKADIVAVQRRGNNITEQISNTKFEAGDILFLQVSRDSFLLLHPEPDFYIRRQLPAPESLSHSIGVSGVDSGGYGSMKDMKETVWRDLQVAYASTEDATHTREYLTAMKIPDSSPLTQKTAFESGLTKLPGIVLVSIERPTLTLDVRVVSGADAADVTSYDENYNDEKVESIPFDLPLSVGDVLWFAGSVNDVMLSLRKIPGLVSYETEQVKKLKSELHERRLVQAVIAMRSPLVGHTPKEARFRTRYGAAIIAVNRGGKRLYEYPGNVKLRAGDLLLLEAGPTFMQKNSDNDTHFSLLAEVENSTPPRLRMLIPALVLTIAMLALAAAEVCSLLISALFAAILMVVFGIISQKEARKALNWFVFVTVGASFGIGTAMQNSGLSQIMAEFFVRISSAIDLSGAGVFGSIYLATGLISNVVTNNAAAALMFPIAYDTAILSGIDPILMTYCVVFGASACYVSPFAYQCNMLVYGPGRYTTMDFVRFGGPLQIFLWIFSTAILSLPQKMWYWSWVGASVVFLVTAASSIFGYCSCIKKSLIGRARHTHTI